MKWLTSNLGLIALSVILILLLLGTAGYYAYAAKKMPDPEILTMPMSYQTAATARPIVNTGVDANGWALDYWTADKDATGLTRAQWTLRGNDPATWVLAAKGKPAIDYRPIEKTVWPLDTKPAGVFVLRNNCFLNKLADPRIARAWVGGDGSSGTGGTMLLLPEVDVPTRTDGCAVKNHFVPFHPAQAPGVWRYLPSALFLKPSNVAAPVRVPFTVVMIEIVPAAPAAPSPAPVKR